MSAAPLRSAARAVALSLLLALLAGCAGGAGVRTGGIAPAAQQSDVGQGDGAAGKAEEPPRSSESTGSQEASPKGVVLKQVYTDERTGLTIKTPLLWEATHKEGYLVVLLSPRNGVEDLYRENVVLVADDQFENLSLAAYLKALAEEVRKRYPDTKTLESGEVVIDSIPGHWMVDAFTDTKGPMKVYRVVLVRDQVAYVLHATAPAELFDLYRPTFEAIARSITWTQQEAKE